MVGTRTKNSIKNAVVSFLSTVLSLIIGFVAQKVFLQTLGLDYLGTNSLLTNVISMLSISELGIGTAIIFHLYKPLSQNNHQQVCALINFYRRSYIIIACAITCLGIIFLPFIPLIVGKVSISENIYIIYILFLLDAALSYLFSYKRSILYASQKNYYVQIIHTIYLIVLNGVQIFLLLQTHNYYLYLVVKLAARLLENLVISRTADHSYPQIKRYRDTTITPNLRKDIFKKVGALLFHQIAYFVVLGTDNILISVFFGTVSVGLYSNYYMITNAINSVIGQVFKSVTAPVGDLIVSQNTTLIYSIYKNINFFNHWLSSFTSIGLFCTLNAFIGIWLGDNYLLDKLSVCMIILNFYLVIRKRTISTFKEAAGVVYEDRFVPIAESLVNLILSIIFLKIFGLSGVFMGTVASNLLLLLYSYPRYVAKPILHEEYKNYYSGLLKEFIAFIFMLAFTLFIRNLIPTHSAITSFLIGASIACIAPNLLFLILYRKSPSLIYYFSLFKRIRRTNAK